MKGAWPGVYKQRARAGVGVHGGQVGDKEEELAGKRGGRTVKGGVVMLKKQLMTLSLLLHQWLEV